MCTKPEYYCEKCCDAQFGSEQYDKMMDCVNQCSGYMNVLKEPSSKITVGFNAVLDQDTQNEFAAKNQQKTKAVL